MQMQRIGKSKAVRATLVAAVLLGTTVSSGGAFSAQSSDMSTTSGSGRSFEAFAQTLADQIAQSYGAPSASSSASASSSGATTQTSVSAPAPSDPSSAVVDQVTQYVQDVSGIDLNDFIPSPVDNPSTPEEQTQAASTTDVINALLALLNGTEPQVLAAIDAAEAAVLAKIDDAKAKTIAAFAQVDLGETETQVLAQIDAARLLVQQAFAQIRANVVAAFAAARTSIIEELTGVDLGSATDIVLAKIAEIQDFVDFALARVQDVLNNLTAGLPS